MSADMAEYPLPALDDRVPQDVLEEIFRAQRLLLAELQRLRDENQALRAELEQLRK